MRRDVTPGRDSIVPFAFEGRSRPYRVHIPASGSVGAATVLFLHGRLGTAKNTAGLTHGSAAADTLGFVAVYADGVDRSWADGRGFTPADRARVNDSGYLSALLDDLVQRFGVSPHQRFVAGISNGGFMALRLACEHADQVAGLAIVASAMTDSIAAHCRPSRAVPAMFVHGTADPLVPYAGGPVARERGSVLSTDATVARWRRVNGCDDRVRIDTLVTQERGMPTTMSAWDHCVAPVRFLKIDGGGHTWPGGPQYLPAFLVGPVAHDIPATRLMVEFLLRERSSH
jgi:polyhydroxybutyrate depolymerase